MNKKRLRYVHDVCPFFEPNALPAFESTHWQAHAQSFQKNLHLHTTGYTIAVFSSRLFSWQRTFTKDVQPVPSLSSSFISLEEWVPDYEYSLEEHKGWKRFGISRKHAVTELLRDTSPTAGWSKQARRHLKTFHAQKDVFIRGGTLHELYEPYQRSHIKPHLRHALWQLVSRHYTVHKDSLTVLVAESKDHGIVAGFVAGDCNEASTSIYLFGFFLENGAHAFPMYGLTEMWLKNTQERGLRFANFGDICGPKPLPFDSEIGYSLFKTHFNVTRIWRPKSRWRLKVHPKALVTFFKPNRYT